MKIVILGISYCVLASFSLSLAQSAPNVQDKHSLNSRYLGLLRSTILSQIPQKPNHTWTYKSGIIEDQWTLRQNSNLATVTLSILYSHSKVVQFELSSNDETTFKGVSFASLLKKKPYLQLHCFAFDPPEGGGYVGFYYDDVQHGSCYKAMRQDNFILTSQPDAIIVHQVGSPVIPIFDGVVGKKAASAESHVYATQSESDKADMAGIVPQKPKPQEFRLDAQPLIMGADRFCQNYGDHIVSHDMAETEGGRDEIYRYYGRIRGKHNDIIAKQQSIVTVKLLQKLRSAMAKCDSSIYELAAVKSGGGSGWGHDNARSVGPREELLTTIIHDLARVTSEDSSVKQQRQTQLDKLSWLRARKIDVSGLDALAPDLSVLALTQVVAREYKLYADNVEE